MTDKASGAGLLFKAVDAMEEVSRSPSPLTIPDLAHRLGWTRPTAHRIVSALAERGMLRISQTTKTIHLGAHLFELAHRSWTDIDLRTAARDPLEQLRIEAGTVAILATPSSQHFVIIDLVGDAIPSGYRIGTSWPLMSSALGMAIIAFDEGASAIHPWPNEDGGLSLEKVNAVQLTNARGYAVGEELGGIVIAAPVFDIFKRPIASIGVVMKGAQIEQAHAIAPRIVDAARQIISNVGSNIKTTDVGLGAAPAMAVDVDVVAHTQLLLGRGPSMISEKLLVCVDTLGPTVWVTDVDSGKCSAYRNDSLLGGTVPLKGGKFGIVDQSGLRVIDDPKRIEDVQSVPIVPPHTRFNSASVDPRGQVWATQMDLDGRQGGGDLVKLDADRGYAPLGFNLAMPGGMAWCTRNRALYFTDSGHKRIYVLDLNEKYEPVGSPQAFWEYSASQDKPDAIAVTSDGDVWVSVWDGWRIDHFSSSRRLVTSYPLPVPRASGLCHNEREDTLYVTSSLLRLSSETLATSPASGAILALRTSVS